MPFSGPSNLGANIGHTSGTTTFSVASVGRYRVGWAVNYTVGVGAAFALAVNGLAEPGTQVDVLTATGHVGGEAVLTLAAGDVLTLRDNSATPVTTDVAPGVGASLVIQRIS